MGNKWRLVRHIETSGAMQMATDESILNARIRDEVPNTLRFFTWKPPCVTVGFFQGLEQEVDTKRAESLGIDVVRRYTGGGAVFHDRELTYSIALLEKDTKEDIIESYREICSGITEGLKSVGIDAKFVPINDIIVNGKKISGNAQTRKEGVVLQHGTILLDVDVEKMFSILRVPDEKIRDKMIASVSERVTSLKRELGKEIAVKELEKAIVAGFEKVFGAEFEESGLTEKETKEAEKLCREKYSTREWCYAR